MIINWYTDLNLHDAQEKYPLAHVEHVPGQDCCLVSIEVQPDDSSYRYRALMQKPTLVLKFSLPCFIEIPVGAYCIFQNQKFTLNSPENIKKQGTRNIEYTITMGTLEDNLSMYKMRNSVDRRLKWSMCAKPHEFIEEIVKNLNERDGADAWSVGDCIDANEKTIEFNHTYLDAALSSVASTFETEFEISEDYVISLHKVEYFKDDPLELAYGRGNGFIPGVGRTTQLEDLPIKRLYLQGTERNIDRSKYGGWDNELKQFTTPFPYKTTSAELRLPPNQSLQYDGSHFEDEEGFVENAAHTYTTDEDGYYIERTDKVSKAVKEDSLDCSEIYPSFVGRVDSVQPGSESNAEKKNFFDIIDSSIPETLNFNDYVIAGENMTIVFQSGMLAGKEFECKYRHKDNQDNLIRKWEIVPQDIDGVTMPGGVYMPAEGDTYAVFGIMLPNEYICDNANKSGASWKMFREGCRKLYEREEQKFTFTGELQGLWAKQNWLNVGGHLKIGGYILFTDEQFAPDGELIRIVGVKDYLTSPYSPTIEIANSVSGGGSSVSANLQKIETTEVVITETEKRMKQFTKRRFRDALETISALDEAMLENFSHSINPVAVQTMSALVGDESLQFQFVEFQLITQENTPPTYLYTKIDDPVEYDSESKILSIPQCYIQHLTLGVTSIESNRDPSHGVGYKQWRMAKFDSPTLTADFGRLYLYAKVPVSTMPPPLPNGGFISGGEFKLETTAHSLREGHYYWLLVGILSSEYEGKRSYVSMYGFTEITPGRITTDKIVSADGSCYFDLANNEIGGAIKFLSDNNYITLIDGGYIKTELINAAELVANHIIAGEPEGQRVEITPDNKAVEIYDADGNLCSIFEGNEYADVSSLFGETSGSVVIANRSSTDMGYNSGTTYGRGIIAELVGNNTGGNLTQSKIINLSDPWNTSTPTEVALNGYIQLSASSYYVKPAVDSIAISPMSYISFIVRLKTYSDAGCTRLIQSLVLSSFSASANAQAQINNPLQSYEPGLGGDDTYTDSNSVNKSFSAIAKAVAGWHRLEITISQSVCGDNNRCSGAWGATTSGRNDIAATYKSDFYVSRYFANGFCLGTRADNYILAYKDAENSMVFQSEVNGVGLQLSSNGLRIKHHNIWGKMPFFIFKGIIYCSDNSASISGVTAFDGTSANEFTVARISKGEVSLSLPDKWKTGDYALGITGCNDVIVQFTGHGVMKGSLSSMGSSGLVIKISDDDSTNDNVHCDIAVWLLK